MRQTLWFLGALLVLGCDPSGEGPCKDYVQPEAANAISCRVDQLAEVVPHGEDVTVICRCVRNGR